jgi:hypothetical protein
MSSAERLSGDPAKGGARASVGARGPIGTLSLLAVGAFLLYWLTGLALEMRQALPNFGADTWFYEKLAEPDALGRIRTDYHLDRITRFHPTTVVLALAWMQVLSPLSQWFDPPQLLRAMSAATGVVGVWAAVSAFSAVMTRGYATLFGIIYALSLGVWYFASIEESKIVTATLSALYIAGYLSLRQRWSEPRAALLVAILLLACLNEIVAGFLVIIPVVDFLMQRRLDRARIRWIGAQVLAGVLALVILEVVLNRWLLAGSKPADEASHFAMMLAYMFRNEHGLASLYLFLSNWLFFNIAAPAAEAGYALPLWPQYKGYFGPSSMADYLASPATAGLAVLFGLMLAAALLPRYRAETYGAASGILLPLAAYTALRGLFFFVFNPAEAQLFSQSVSLVHLLIVGIPFAASSFPAKRALLAAFALLLFIVNGSFMFRL